LGLANFQEIIFTKQLVPDIVVRKALA